jgi:hypothetical protein
MGENVTNPSRDYYVVTRRYGDPPTWMWEIQRRSRPLGVRIYGDGFGSEAVAKVLGEKALRQFLEALAKEHPAKAPAPLRSTDEYESMSSPHNNGIIPPIVEPMRIPIQIDPRIEKAPSKK